MAKVPCTHCHLEFDESVMITEKEGEDTHYFCCKGCQGIYHLLRSEGLDTFYDKLGKNRLEPPKELSDDLHKFDLEGFKKKYIVERSDGLYEIFLIIEGIHCAACVWLNEKVLHQTQGIVEATINYTTNKAHVVWDPEEIKLSQIIEKIRAIGYNAYPYDPKLQEERANRARRDYYSRLLVAIFATMNIMWIAVAQYTGMFTGMRSDVKQVLNVAEWVLATPTLFYSGWVFFRGAWYGLKNRFVNMDLLVAAGASLAYLYSLWAMVTGKGEVYFDSVTMIITFVLAGKYLEVLSKKRAADTMDALTSALPTEVTVVQNGEKAMIPVEEVQPGDIIEVRPGEKVAIDGVVVSGEGSFDESSLTGESEPIYKRPGDEIVSGSVAIDGVVRYEATKDYSSSMLTTLVGLLEESLTKKPKIERLANEISGWFSLTILSIAFLTFLGWLWMSGEFERALVVSISVIVIACPCALGLATPVATLIGINLAARRGVLFKEAAFIETMAKADVLVLDKTGTITEGKPHVVSYETYGQCDVNWLYSLVKSSIHPVSQGIVHYLKAHNEYLEEVPLEQVKQVQARGITAEFNGHTLQGGNAKMMEEFGIEVKEDSEYTLFYFAVDGKAVARFELRDLPKQGAKEAIEEIGKLGIDVIMLTGDNEKAAARVAEEVGIPRFKAALFPEEKAKKIDKLHAQGRIVVMAGDGINDALALSKSDIAIAMGSGSDVALEVSDVVLLDDRITSLRDAFLISRRTFRFVKQNLALSVVYNSVTIPLAVAGYVIPLVAALSMSLSSLMVVGNSMRIKSAFKKKN
ncbi:heavy metal translocating P-type ATPase [Hydrogenimonas urashimensis]|uniref:heavy metal translocating P-type ATPase n=1 Tax=Hydrogenimonas urashimensis TaxID=2740515 RepID=UPI0019160507|nr:heavy metal translocating P-type ATPase [Hydrogenimonas urashimensis]